MSAHVGIPVTRQSHERVSGWAFRKIRWTPGIFLIGLRNPIVHNGAAWVDRKAQLITKLARKLDRSRTKAAAGPDDGNRRFIEIFLYISHGTLQFTCEEFIRRIVVHVDIVDEAMRLIIDPAFF